ncbi:MAG: serine hydrolase domain-containing protein [Deltaproteobacteria bacterium]
MRQTTLLTTTLLALAACADPPVSDDHTEVDQVSNDNGYWTGLKDLHWTTTQNDLVDDQMASLMEDDNIPGCAIGVVEGTEVTYMGVYGEAVEGSVPWSTWTIAPVASVTKTYTAAAIMHLQELGLLDIDDPISDHLAIGGATGTRTIRQTLSHSAGFAQFPTLDNGPCPAEYAGAPAAWCLSHPRHAFEDFKANLNPQTLYPGADEGIYSNTGYVILGAIVDEISRSTPGIPVHERGYERFVWHNFGHYLADPLADDTMTSLALTLPWRLDDINNYATGYCGTGAICDAELDLGSWGGPAGGWSMTIGDLTRFVRAQIDGELLTPTSWEAMYVKHTDVDDIVGLGETAGEHQLDYGLGVGRDNTTLTQEAWHGGDIQGHSAVWFIRRNDLTTTDDDIGVAMICNSGAPNSQTFLKNRARSIANGNGGTTTPIVMESRVNPGDTRRFAGLAFDVDARASRMVSHDGMFLPLDTTHRWRFAVAVGPNGLEAQVAESNVSSNGSLLPIPGKAFSFGALVADGPRHMKSAPRDVQFDVLGGRVTLQDATVRFSVTAKDDALADGTLSGTVDLRQLGSQGVLPWTQVCASSQALDQQPCQPCDDGVAACLDVAYDRIMGLRTN